MPVRNLFKPRKMAVIINFCFIQADLLECGKAGIGAMKVSVCEFVASFNFS